MRNRFLTLSSFVVGAALVGCGGDPGANLGAQSTAQAVYASYQAGAHDRVKFDVSTLESGLVSELAGRPINEYVGVPNYWLRSQQNAVDLTNLVQEPRDVAGDEWQKPIDLAHFADLGRSLADGRYELLHVRMNLDGNTSEHRALQVCFDSQRFCTIMDPVVLQLSAFAENRARLLAEGWKVQVEETLVPTDVRRTQAATCSLNSNPAAKTRTLTKSGYTIDYKDVFGITLVHKSLGAQQAGISCYVSGSSCFSSGFGYSNSSSCYGNLGYNCDCDNTGNLDGTSQPATRSWSETRCAHQLVLNANVSFSVNGTGANFSVNWTTSGSVDANGGQIYDSCSFH